ncbi:MAG: hypothetical protein LLF76_12775 [Planctomycetaceae bacterium]|nr:hypothetical protein [Planctomycetaceae bacterium]
MRKFTMILCSAAVVAMAFWGYLRFAGSSSGDVADTSDVQDLTMPPPNIMPARPGETILQTAVQARYTILDPVTKRLSRVLGFETLLNPGTDSTLWQVEKPYIEFYEPTYSCRMDSQKGTFTVSSMGGSMSPTDARLQGSVVIHIQPQPGSKFSETYIYMDDLAFSSERSEFSTDGPVRVVSEQMLLEGFGMILIFNTGTGKLEYVNIRDLEQLVLKNIVEPGSDKPSKPAQTVAARQQRSETVNAVTPGPAQETAQRANGAQGDLYQCTMDNNVLIRYGEQLVVTGADNLTIQNILLKSAASEVSGDSPPPAGKTPAGELDAMRGRTAPENKEPQVAAESGAAEQPIKGRDIIVTCDGGIIFQPMKTVSNTANSLLNLRMSGAPLRIEHFASAGQDQTLVQCGRLEYNPQEDVLRLFTNAQQRQITFDAQSVNSRIETQGSMLWNRPARTANVAGPGKIYLSNAGNPAREQNEVAFQGEMKLLFSQLSDQSSSIEKINLTGGIDAVLKDDGGYKTSAQSAQLDFGPGNMLSQAFLDGGVKFESLAQANPQSASSQSAAFKFGSENKLATAEMTGGVFFESREKDKAAKAKAQKAVFFFDNSKIRTANLEGDVQFASDAGQVASADATIDFTADAAGVLKPGKVYTAGNAVLLAAVSAADEPPARFEARKIDYDLQSRSGMAYGPVRFTFYHEAEAGSSSVEPWIPVVITAEENTEFLSDESGAMDHIVFHKNVLASRLFKSFNYTQTDQFHGDVLTVYLGQAEAGRRGINRIQLTEGNVFAESVRTQNNVKLSHIKLSCTDMAWDRLANRILAKGPGQMELDNSQIEQPNAAVSSPALSKRPAFARVTGFDVLNWDLAAQTLVADGNKDTLQLAYVPLLNGTPEKFLYASSVRFEVFLMKDPAGKIVVKRAYTDTGITFRELDSDQSKTLNEMIGQSLDYNPVEGGWLKIIGSPAVPCFLNGARVPSIFVNVDTGRIETSLSTVPSVYTK